MALHVSLSAPLVLDTDQRDLFQENLGANLMGSNVKPFCVRVTGLDWVPNHERTRFFLVLRLRKPDNDELNKLLSLCNKSALRFGLPLLYQSPERTPRRSSLSQQSDLLTADRSDAFHISIAWSLSEPSEQIKQGIEAIKLDQLCELDIYFSLLKVKIGNVVTDLPFNLGAGSR